MAQQLAEAETDHNTATSPIEPEREEESEQLPDETEEPEATKAEQSEIPEPTDDESQASETQPLPVGPVEPVGESLPPEPVGEADGGDSGVERGGQTGDVPVPDDLGVETEVPEPPDDVPPPEEPAVEIPADEPDDEPVGEVPESEAAEMPESEGEWYDPGPEFMERVERMFAETDAEPPDETIDRIYDAMDMHAILLDRAQSLE